MTDKKVAVLVIHGMGAQKSNYANKMIKELKHRVKNEYGKKPDSIAWESIHWAPILQEPQLEYLKEAKKLAELDFISLRRFVVTYLGDAIAYQKSSKKYKAIHSVVRDAIKALYDSLGNPTEENLPKLIVLAHSLGGHIMSNYIWDLQQKKEGSGYISPERDNSFERMDTLIGMVTFGCNIPLFALAKTEGKNLDLSGTAIKFDGKWSNFYDRDDVFGYPLKPIYPTLDSSQPKLVLEDIPINVGGIFTSWNPMCHNDYWTDNDFTKPVAKLIAKYCQ